MQEILVITFLHLKIELSLWLTLAANFVVLSDFYDNICLNFDNNKTGI